MHFVRFALATLLCSLVLAPLARAQATALELSNQQGATLTFTSIDGRWRWTGLLTPARPEAFVLNDTSVEWGTAAGTDGLADGWQLESSAPDRVVFEQEAPRAGLRLRRVFTFGAAPHVVRIETWVRSVAGAQLLRRAGLLNLEVAGESFRTTGASPASFPVFGRMLFAGVEHVSGDSRAEADWLRLGQTPDLSVGEEWQLLAPVVVGWHAPRAALFLPGESRTRDAFLQYLDVVRVKPADIVLHSDTWWTLPVPFNEADILRDLAALRKGFFERTGMFFDTYALDLGWSDPKSVWAVDAKNFPNGLGRINEELASMGAKMGLWVSPSSGYPPGLDNAWLASAGYEMTTLAEDAEKVACFALGNRYTREFTERVTGYAREFGLGHVIFDYMHHACDHAEHLHGTGAASSYSIAAGLRDVLDRLRLINPRIALEPLCTGTPPSPWWNMHSPFILGPAGDDVPYGRVPAPDWNEALISARDVAYRAGQEQWLMRTQTLETFDIIQQSPGVFQNMAAIAIGRGRWFVSNNIRPELMQPADWDFLAALIRWQRANRAHLVDARMFGGQPAQREAYGYHFHHADRDIYCIRNPWIEERAITLPARVPETRDLQMIYPRRGAVGRVRPGEDGPTIALGPYEMMFIETVPAAAAAPLPLAPIAERADVTASAREVAGADSEEGHVGFRYTWSGTLTLPDVKQAELCIVVEGAEGVADASGSVLLDDRPARLQTPGSGGMFGAAVDASPDNWKWFITPLAAGRQRVELELNVPLPKAAVGVYLRAAAPATSDAAPEGVPAFPVYQADRRSWSQTLQQLATFNFGPTEAEPEADVEAGSAAPLEPDGGDVAGAGHLGNDGHAVAARR